MQTTEKIILDGARMLDKTSVRDEIALQLRLPDYFSGTLDGLWDFISATDADVTLIHADALLDALGPYGLRLIKTFQEAVRVNPRFRFRTET